MVREMIGVTAVAGVFTVAAGAAFAQPERPYPTGRTSIDAANAPIITSGATASSDFGRKPATQQPAPAQTPPPPKNPCAAKPPVKKN